jgi:hypothetical protein
MSIALTELDHQSTLMKQKWFSPRQINRKWSDPNRCAVTLLKLSRWDAYGARLSRHRRLPRNENRGRYGYM